LPWSYGEEDGAPDHPGVPRPLHLRHGQGGVCKENFCSEKESNTQVGFQFIKTFVLVSSAPIFIKGHVRFATVLSLFLEQEIRE